MVNVLYTYITIYSDIPASVLNFDQNDIQGCILLSNGFTMKIIQNINIIDSKGIFFTCFPVMFRY